MAVSRRDGPWVLQWGRGGEAAESSVGAPVRQPDRGFNGAAAVRPRKATCSDCDGCVADGLQWGRGGEAAERTLP